METWKRIASLWRCSIKCVMRESSAKCLTDSEPPGQALLTVSVCYNFSKSQCSVVALNQHKDVRSSCWEILSVGRHGNKTNDANANLLHTHTHTHTHMQTQTHTCKHARSHTHTWTEDALQGAAVTSPASRSTAPMH